MEDTEEVRDFIVRDAQGRVVLQVGLLVTLYFRKAYTQSVRERVARCFEEWAHPGKRGFQRLDRPAERDPAQWLREPDPEGKFEASGWEFYWHGGETKEEASGFRIKALGAANQLGDELSFLSASLPLSWYVDHSGDFPSLVLHWSQILSPLHGYGGVAILESPRLSIAQTHGAAAYAMARRFPGLEMDDPLGHVLYLKNAIKGGSWVTVLSQQFIERLGGLPVLSGYLGEGFLLHPYPDGVVIQAGPTPELGDVNRRLVPARSQRLAQVLRPLRPQVHGGFDGFGLTRGQSEEWLARFDPL
jgi:hypothetical protein